MSKSIDDDVRRALDSLDDMQSAAAPPFLYTKVKARLAARKAGTGYSFLSLFRRPAISFAILLVTVVLNIYMLTKAGESERVSNTKATPAETFATTYGLVSYSAYDKTY